MPVEQRPSLEDIEQCLPQTQCTQCSYPSCTDYAQALSVKDADINRCPPGGDTTIAALAQLFGSSGKSLASDCQPFTQRLTAIVREAHCIGCTLCIAPCPTDAIIGAAKHMHSVVQQNCTGCGLCVNYCPVDCIDMIAYTPKPPGQRWKHFGDEEVRHWKTLAEKRKARQKLSAETLAPEIDSLELKRQIRDAVNRERNKRCKNARKQSVRARQHFDVTI